MNYDRMNQILAEVKVLDETIKSALDRRAGLLLEMEQIMAESGLQDYTDGEYRAKFVHSLRVSDAERLHAIAPHLVTVEQIVNYKVNSAKLRAAWSTDLREQLSEIVQETADFRIERERRKTVAGGGAK